MERLRYIDGKKVRIERFTYFLEMLFYSQYDQENLK